jgi:glycosyltransferase involved in cell wall biosynthesis
VSAEETSDADGVDVTVAIPTRNRSRLLAKTIASVLAQSYRDFTLVVSDNASDDDTADVVASFRDPRLDYRPLKRNIGRAGNFNRLIDLVETDFVVLLGDDDALHPDHLAVTVDALKGRPNVGMVHTGCVIVDTAGDTLVPHARPVSTKAPIMFESGRQFLERSMRSGWTVCLSSANFRREALVSGGGPRPQDGVIDDFPQMMRIAMGWDFAYVNRPLALMRAHDEADSSELGWFTPDGFRSSASVPEMLDRHRRNFLAEANLPARETRRLSRIAEKTYRRERLAHLSMCALGGDGQAAVFRGLASELRRDRRLWIDPRTWRFVIGQLGARRLRDSLRRALERARDRRDSEPPDWQQESVQP